MINKIKKIKSLFIKDRSFYINKASKLIAMEEIDQANKWIEDGLKKYPNHVSLTEMLLDLSEIYIKDKEWNKARNLLIKYKAYSENKLPLKAGINLSILNNLLGEFKESEDQFYELLEDYSNEIDADEKGYRKVDIFDNGESRIEYYKKLHKTNAILITFDSVNIVWDRLPFAFNLLIRQNVDIIAVRKRKKDNFFQDLSKEEFSSIVNPLLKGYEDKSVYGFSLGAYAALYYTTDLVDRILAISPRLPIHPRYGQTKFIGKYEFNHNESLEYNPDISPIVVYDPKNKLDNKYINEVVDQAFSNAAFIEVPYGSHSLTHHLLKMGILKEFVLTFLNDNELPVYKKEWRKRSSIYYKTLANVCLKRNKPKWALQLIEEALRLEPDAKDIAKQKTTIVEKIKCLQNESIS